MADEVEKKVEATPALRPSDASRREANFTDEKKQGDWSKATEDYRTTKRQSATHECLTDEQIADLERRGLGQKFEITGMSGPGNGSAEDTGTVIDYQPKEKVKNKSFALGMDYEEERDTRSVYEKLTDFARAAGERATDPEGWKSYIQGELDKMIGVGEGLNIAKESTKATIVAGWNALTDGTVANFLAKPNAINDPLFHAVGGALTAMAEDPSAVSHALERVGTIVISGSERYSALPNREKGHVIGETMFGLVNPEGSTEAGELALKIADGVATHVDATVMKAIQQSLKAAEEAARTSPEVALEMKQMLQNYLRQKGLTGPELEYAGVPKGYFDGLETPSKGDNYFAMSAEGEGTAYRGDHDIFARENKAGLPKSFIDRNGDLSPCDPNGLFKGKPIDVIHHLCGGFYKHHKRFSPFTSFSESGEIINKFGEKYKITADLKALEKAIANGDVAGVEIIPHQRVLQMIEDSPCHEYSKKKARAYAVADKEVLIRGVIPKRFLTIEEMHK